MKKERVRSCKFEGKKWRTLRYDTRPPLGRSFCLVGNPQQAEVPINRASFFRYKDVYESRIRIAPILIQL
jgi:hypothetical protein